MSKVCIHNLVPYGSFILIIYACFLSQHRIFTEVEPGGGIFFPVTGGGGGCLI
jgi:hypothetical protein